MNLERVYADGESMHRELGREYYEAGAGLKSDPAFQAIYERYLHLGSDEALALAQESESLPLIDWVLGIRIGQRTASLEEQQMAWEQQAVVESGGEQIPYLRVPIELANSPDRERRTSLEEAKNRLGAAALNPIRRDRFSIEREQTEALGLGTYVESRTILSEIDLDELGEQAQAFLAQTEDLYRDVLARLAQKRLGLPVDDLRRSDVGWMFRGDGYDQGFDPSRMLEIATSQMREMGLDASQSGRVRFDTDDRKNKQPRAFCCPVRVPEEVYLVLQPSGGHSDYRTFWHELGHAMHFASVDPAQTFEARWLGDNSVTEGFAMLWDHLTINRGWLRRYVTLSKTEVENLTFELAVGELHMLRRYAAKIGYELVLHRGDLSSLGDEYAERLSSATLFRYGPENALIDVDPNFYCARYLRAWQLEAALADTLRDRFDEDWWRNPRAGAFVQHLMSRGQAEPAHRLAAEVIGPHLSFAPCVSRLEAVLG